MVKLFSWLTGQVERRKHPRHSMIATVWLRVKDDPLPFVCVLWDLSEEGARLGLPKASELPDEVIVSAKRDDFNGTRCRIVWRSEDQIGVCFVENGEPLRWLLRQQKALASTAELPS